MKIKFKARVLAVEEKFLKQHVSGTGDAAVFQNVSQGWFVRFEKSYESLNVGSEKPPIKEGDVATIEISFP